MEIYIGLLALAILGMLVYALANGKVAELGRLAFACALLALCLGAGTALHAVVHLGR
jgi:hypothetical protein